MIINGIEYWLTAEAVRHLEVDPERLRDWVRRSKAAGHRPVRAPLRCLACRPGVDGFPHVDPPFRSKASAWYLAEQLREAEHYTGTSTRTGRIRAGA